MAKDDLDLVWKALSSPIRRRMLDMLKNAPMITSAIVAELELNRFVVMQHLEVLEQANLVLVRREGKLRYNALNPIPIREIYERWVSGFASHGAETALRLKQFVEQGEEKPMQVMSEKSIKIEMEMTINAPPQKIYEALFTRLDEWWPHRFKDGSKVIVEPHVGGRIYEDWGTGQALYGVIQYFDPPNKFGVLGPGGMTTAYSMMSWESVEPLGDDQSRHKKTMFIWGDVDPEKVEMFQNGVKSIFEAMKTFVEGNQ